MKGDAAETEALQHLVSQGLKLLARNYRCRFGEIDLILEDGATLVFVEVRKRTGSGFGGAVDSITAAKRARLVATAKHYLSRRKSSPCRFDAVLLQGAEPIRWVKNAFEA
ncbi:MAG: YraN family protein [Burkholderiales bacterium]